MDFLAILVYLAGAAIGFVVLYWVIRLAVLHALYEHTKNSITAVTVRESASFAPTPPTATATDA